METSERAFSTVDSETQSDDRRKTASCDVTIRYSLTRCRQVHQASILESIAVAVPNQVSSVFECALQLLQPNQMDQDCIINEMEACDPLLFQSTPTSTWHR